MSDLNVMVLVWMMLSLTYMAWNVVWKNRIEKLQAVEVLEWKEWRQKVEEKKIDLWETELLMRENDLEVKMMGWKNVDWKDEDWTDATTRHIAPSFCHFKTSTAVSSLALTIFA